MHHLAARFLARRSSLLGAPTWLGTLLALCLLSLSAPGQTVGGSTATGPFVWAENLPAGGLLKFSDANPAFGWFLVKEGVKIRSVPSYSPLAGPTFEVFLDAPQSGHPTKPEIFLLQLPANFPSIPPKERALVMAFHQFGVSHKAPFLNTSLPTECARRDWLLFSPAGLSQTNFANKASQDSLDTTLELVWQLLPFNPRRVYTVGFSMGGANALSYAMRKQDPKGLRVAGVVCHTGTVDVIQEALSGSPALLDLLSDEFGGTYAANPFAYDRINPARVPQFAPVDPLAAYARNLLDVPIFFHQNVQDPNVGLLEDNLKLHQFLKARGGNVTLDQVSAGFNVHKWSTLPVTAALDFVSSANTPPPVPTGLPAFTLFADLEQTTKFVDVQTLDPETVGRVQVELPPPGANFLGVNQVFGIRSLGLDVVQVGLDPSLPLQLATSSVDGQPTTLELRGFAGAPTQVLVNGGPPAASSYDAGTGTLTLIPTANGGFGLVDVLP